MKLNRSHHSSIWIVFVISLALLLLTTTMRYARLAGPDFDFGFTQSDVAVALEHAVWAFGFPYVGWMALCAYWTLQDLKATDRLWLHNPVNRALVLTLGAAALGLTYLLGQVGHEYEQLLLAKPDASYYGAVMRCMPAHSAAELAACVSPFSEVQSSQHHADLFGVAAYIAWTVWWTFSWLRNELLPQR